MGSESSRGTQPGGRRQPRARSLQPSKRSVAAVRIGGEQRGFDVSGARLGAHARAESTSTKRSPQADAERRCTPKTHAKPHANTTQKTRKQHTRYAAEQLPRLRRTYATLRHGGSTSLPTAVTASKRPPRYAALEAAAARYQRRRSLQENRQCVKSSIRLAHGPTVCEIL